MSNNQEEKLKGIAKLFLINHISITVIIPAKIAKKHKLTKGSYVSIRDVDDGLLINKVNVS